MRPLFREQRSDWTWISIFFVPSVQRAPAGSVSKDGISIASPKSRRVKPPLSSAGARDQSRPRLDCILLNPPLTRQTRRVVSAGLASALCRQPTRKSPNPQRHLPPFRQHRYTLTFAKLPKMEADVFFPYAPIHETHCLERRRGIAAPDLLGTREVSQAITTERDDTT